MTRLSLLFVSTVVACVIGLAPQKETGAAFQPAPLKTRSLAAGVPKAPQGRSLGRDACASSARETCKSSNPGSVGPRG